MKNIFTRFNLWICVLAVLTVFTVLLSACSTPPVLVRANLFSDISVLPITYGQSTGYFEEEGIQLETQLVNAGEIAAEKITEGTLDIGLMSSYAYVRSLIAGHDLNILSVYGTTYHVYELLVHVDSQIQRPEDLNEKTIGLLTYTQGELFFESLVNYYNLDVESINIVHQEGPDWKNDFWEGKIDAVISAEPAVSELLSLEGNRISRIPLGKFMRSDMIFVASPDYIQSNKKTIVNFLKAVHRANLDFQNPDQEIFNRLESINGIPRPSLEVIFAVADFDLILDQLILTTMEAQFDWLKRHDGKDFSGNIHFLDKLYFDALEEVNPDGISINR